MAKIRYKKQPKHYNQSTHCPIAEWVGHYDAVLRDIEVYGVISGSFDTRRYNGDFEIKDFYGRQYNIYLNKPEFIYSYWANIEGFNCVDTL